MQASPDHPELIFGQNPFIEALAPYTPFSKLPGKLRNEPLQDVPWRNQPPEYRVPHLKHISEHYWPTRNVLELADSIQFMLRAGLDARNPLSPREQRRINQLALAKSPRDMALHSLRTPACASICSAITGMSKTKTAERTLEIVAPDQIVNYGSSQACGWSKLVQVTYLIVDAPSNGSRRGLLSRIAMGLDALLGADYSDQMRKMRNVDVELQFIVKILSIHRVGLLVIDEHQLDNFEESCWQREFVLFFLALMNFGIPVLLMGNPLAFGGLESFSQVMRRFSSCGYHRLIPAASAMEDWWKIDFVPGERRFSLCEQTPSTEEILEVTYPISGGNPGLFAALWKEAQQLALRRGGEQTRLTREDFLSAAGSPGYIKLVDVANQLTGKTEQRFTDIPQGETSGGTRASATAPSTDACRYSDAEAMALIKKIANKFDREQKQRADRQAKNLDALKKLKPEDLRNKEIAAEILTGMEAVQRRLAMSQDRECTPDKTDAAADAAQPSN